MNGRTSTLERGQNLVEFGMVVTLLVVIILIIVDLGRITYTFISLSNAVREGARYGVIHPTDTTDIENYARGLAVGLDQSRLSIVPVYNSMAETITVTGIYEFRTGSPILGLIFGGDLYTMQAESLKHTEE